MKALTAIVLTLTVTVTLSVLIQTVYVTMALLKVQLDQVATARIYQYNLFLK